MKYEDAEEYNGVCSCCIEKTPMERMHYHLNEIAGINEELCESYKDNQMKWISVKDKKPDRYKKCLIYWTKPESDDLGWAISCYPVGLADYSEDYGWNDPFDRDGLEEPDYWMYVDDIPKPGGEHECSIALRHYKKWESEGKPMPTYEELWNELRDKE
jgi:hypothetical protein